MSGLPVRFEVNADHIRRLGEPVVTERDGDAYVVGDLNLAMNLAAEAEGNPDWGIVLTCDEHGHWKSIDTSENYWGNGLTPEAAIRWLVGAVLDPREES